MQKNVFFLLLGTNLGHRIALLREAVQQIERQIAPVLRQSAIYETAPWGVTNQPTFLNQVLQLESILHPIDILQRALKIEKELGRERHERWGARLIDIDLLYYGDVILKMTDLTVPHPRLHERRFTLVPLAEIAPDFVHPILKKNNQELLAICTDSGEVIVYEIGNGDSVLGN